MNLRSRIAFARAVALMLTITATRSRLVAITECVTTGLARAFRTVLGGGHAYAPRFNSATFAGLVAFLSFVTERAQHSYARQPS